MAAGTMVPRPESRGTSFTEADDKDYGDEVMESAGWWEVADDNNVVVRDDVAFLACGEWSISCGV